MCENVSACAYFRMLLCICVWMYMMLRGASASCRIIQMLPSCLLIPLLGQLSPHRRDQNRTMPVRMPPFAVLEKGNLQLQSLWRRFWIATALHVYSPKLSALIMCVCFKALRRFVGESQSNGITSKPNNALLGRWVELLLWGLWVKLLYVSVPIMLQCSTLDPLYCFWGLVQ